MSGRQAIELIPDIPVPSYAEWCAFMCTFCRHPIRIQVADYLSLEPTKKVPLPFTNRFAHEDCYRPRPGVHIIRFKSAGRRT